MIQLIVGAQGSGKTAKLVEVINNISIQEDNIVCIERGNRLNELVKCDIRLINIEEYPCNSFDQLLAFVAGICSKDYDLTHIYIDSVCKVANENDIDKLTGFITKLDEFSSNTSIIITIVISEDIDALPAELKKYA